MNFAVDFDGTLVTNKYPEIGRPNYKLINFCKRRQSLGDNIILWTCRTGKYLDDAITYLKDVCAFTPNYINENAPWDHTLYPTEGRKIGADYYIDDKAVPVYDIDKFIDNFEELSMNSKTLNNLDDNFLNKVDTTISTNKSMTSKQLEEYLKNINSSVFQPVTSSLEDWKPYLGKCPYCGSTNIEANYGIVLASMPPQYNCRCKDCKGTFFSGQIKEENQTITPYLPDLGLPSYPNQPQRPDYGYGGNYGWICPKCGKVNAPHISFCDCSSGKGWDIVWCNANNTSGNNPNPAPTITVSGSTLTSNENNVVNVADLYTFETCNLHENKGDLK